MRTVYRSTTIHEADDDAIRIDRQYPDCQGAWDHRPPALLQRADTVIE